MKQLIKQLLREGLVLNENTLYGNNIIQSTTNRIGDKSDDTLNKLAISGLYRNVFGDIQQLKTKEQLDTIFNNWYEQTITNLTKTPSFIDNKPLATKYLDAYVKNIKSLGSNAKPFSFKKVEQGLVDLVNNNNWIEDTSIKQTHNINNPKSEDVVYEDENIIILDTNTKAKCVMYGQGESWCITKPELNYYNTYRIKYGATPYFVLQKNESKPKNKVVIMHYESGYAIADQTNSGDMTGGNSNNNYSWSKVENILPNLRGLEKYFPYREITDDERKYEEIIVKTKGYKGNNLQGYIDSVIKGLVINGSQVEAVDFIRDYATTRTEIDDNKLQSLRPELIDSLIEGGYFFSSGDEQTYLLNNKQQLRVVRLKLQNNFDLNYIELYLLTDEEQTKYVESLDNDMVNNLLYYTPKENKLELAKLILPLVKDRLDKDMVDNLLNKTPEKNRFNIDKENPGVINLILPLVKDRLDRDMVGELLNHTPEKNKFNIDKENPGVINLILPLVKDRLDRAMVGELLYHTPEENKEYVQGLINQAKGINEKIVRIKQLFK